MPWAKRRYKVMKSGEGNFKGVTEKPYWIVVGPGLRTAPTVYQHKVAATAVALDMDAVFDEAYDRGRMDTRAKFAPLLRKDRIVTHRKPKPKKKR